MTAQPKTTPDTPMGMQHLDFYQNTLNIDKKSSYRGSSHVLPDGFDNSETNDNTYELDQSPSKVQKVGDGEAFKAIVVGNSNVGKTRLTYLYTNGQLPPQSKDKTMGVECFGKTVQVQHINDDTKQPFYKQIRISFYDTAGQERFDAITKAHYRKAMGALVCYSVTDQDSFIAVEKWIQQIKDNAGPECQIILVGTKKDSLDRVIPEEEGAMLAEHYEIDFFEVSANKNTNVNKAM